MENSSVAIENKIGNKENLVGSLNDILGEAIQAFNRDDLERAEEILRQIVERHQNVGTAWHIRGLIAQKQGNLDHALLLLGKALEILPDHPVINRDRGEAFLTHGKTTEALITLLRAVELAPNDPATHFHLGNAYAWDGDFDLAVKHHRICVKLNPKSSEASSNLSATLRKNGRPNEACLAAKQAINLQSDYAKAHNNLGLAYCDLHRYPEAISSFRNALKIDSQYIEVMNNIGVALQANGQIDEAENFLQIAIYLLLSHLLTPVKDPLVTHSPFLCLFIVLKKLN